jgi:hypothetical protein
VSAWSQESKPRRRVRTGELAASLRIEVRRDGGRRQIAVVDPMSREELTLARDVEASHLKDLNTLVSSQLDGIAIAAKADPVLDASYAREICSELYLAGFWALMRLLDHSDDVTPDTVHAFCSARVHEASPSVVEIVAERDDRFFFEVLPLFGSIDSIDEYRDVGLSELARVVLGFRSIVRHRDWTATSEYTPEADVEVPVPLRFFRHSELAGSALELEHLHTLERRGKANIAVQYPPRGFQPPDRKAEFQLVRVLANPWPNGGRDAGRASLVCHFSCHQRRHADGAYLELKADGFWPRPKPVSYRLDRLAVAFEHTDVVPPEAKICFLSACTSATTDPALLLSALDALSKLRAQSVVGTLARVPELMAAEFTRHFYSAICDGWSVGAAVHAARQELLKEPLRNPLGILFVSYRGEDVYFATRADRLAKYVPSAASVNRRAA